MSSGELRIEYLPLSKIRRFDKNPKKHDVGALVTSIRRYGFRDAPIFDATLGALVAGHGRLKALDELQKQGGDPPAGIRVGAVAGRRAPDWLVPVQLGVDAKSAAEAQAFLIDHNALTVAGGDGGPDAIFDLYDHDGLAELLKEAGEAGEMPVTLDGDDLDALLGVDKPVLDAEPQFDKADELRQKWGVERGQLWRLGDHRLLCGDSTSAEDVGRLMGGERADCVFTSPPYAVGVDYGTYEDTIGNLRAMLPALASLWRSLIVDGGFAVVNFGDIVSGRVAAGASEVCEYPMALDYWPVFRAAGFALWSRRVWCKPVARVAAPWCASSNRSATNFEHVWTWKTDGPAIIGRVPGPMDSQTGWFDTSRMDGVDVGKGTHGAGMPTSTALWMLTVHSRSGSVVHEPFCGTGTTIVAAENLNRRCFALEIEPKYVAVAIQRWADATGKTPERVD